MHSEDSDQTGRTCHFVGFVTMQLVCLEVEVFCITILNICITILKYKTNCFHSFAFLIYSLSPSQKWYIEPCFVAYFYTPCKLGLFVCVCKGGYTVFTSGHASICLFVCLFIHPWHFGFSLVSWKGIDGNSSNFADTLIWSFIMEN